jgi:hypothetical protein
MDMSPGLKVYHRDTDLARGKRPGKRGVDVADDKQRVGLLGDQELLERDHRFAGLHSMRAGTNAEEPGGRGQVEV